MGDLSEHFSAHEFKCRDGSEHPINPALIGMLEKIREHYGVSVTILSGYRSPAHNRKIKGAKNSQHLLGNAADIRVGDVAPSAVHLYCHRTFKTGGVGRYKTFTHIDCRQARVRW